MPKTTPTSLRLDPAMIKRLDALVPKVQQTRYGELGVLSRSKILRLVVLRGLEAMEAEVAVPPSNAK